LAKVSQVEHIAMRVLSYQELQTVKGIPHSDEWIRHLSKAGKFPRPVQLGGKRIGFIESEVDQWLRDRAAERDSESATESTPA
jgi:prophage regulatory protein